METKRLTATENGELMNCAGELFPLVGSRFTRLVFLRHRFSPLFCIVSFFIRLVHTSARAEELHTWVTLVEHFNCISFEWKGIAAHRLAVKLLAGEPKVCYIFVHSSHMCWPVLMFYGQLKRKRTNRHKLPKFGTCLYWTKWMVSV